MEGMGLGDHRRPPRRARGSFNGAADHRMMGGIIGWDWGWEGWEGSSDGQGQGMGTEGRDGRPRIIGWEGWGPGDGSGV
eukprot:753971-Hanusia_phi.AAC.1